MIKNSIFNTNKQTIEEIRTATPKLYEQFCEAGVIIDSLSDEIKLLQEKVRKCDDNHNEFILHINPTLDCNFSCWYCYENHIANSRMNGETVEAVKSFITQTLSDPEIKSFELGFFGGEPLFHFDSIAKRIILHSSQVCKKFGKELHIHFTSNGALLNEEMIDFLSKFSCGFQITLDGGKESHDSTRYFKNKRGSFDIIINNVVLLLKKGINVILRVNYTVENIGSVKEILDYFISLSDDEKQFIKFDFQRVWQDKVREKDTAEIKIMEIRKVFRKNGFFVLANYIPHNVEDSCYGDKKNHLLINYDGNVFGCTARDFTDENKIGKINSIGKICFDSEKTRVRDNAKLSKEVCRTCRIAPICGGGCKQRAVEDMDNEECTMRYTESQINDIVLDIFEHSFLPLNQ
ncbi:MAG: radical SAM protein [Muribaculaceae bacterium]|nr:radical SAM protein [Muribaculaceae bacterium]